MPRPLRPIDDGLVYHVINRGNNRPDVFHKPADFQAFLQALADLGQDRGDGITRANRGTEFGSDLSRLVKLWRLVSPGSIRPAALDDAR